MKDCIQGRIYLLHRFILTREVNYYEPLDTKGLFLLCSGNIDDNKSDLYVRTAKSKWLKWPVNINECRIYISIEGQYVCYDSPDISIDSRGRYCFDAIGLLDSKKIGYVSTNPYSAHARVQCSMTYGCACPGGVWSYYGKKGGPGILTIACSYGFIKMDTSYVYMIIANLSNNIFKEHPELGELVNDFLYTKRETNQNEITDFLSNLATTHAEIRFFDSDLMLESSTLPLSFTYKEDYHIAVRRSEPSDMYGMDLTNLVSCNHGKGALCYLHESDGKAVPGKLVFHNRESEKAVQLMMNPDYDYIVYRDPSLGEIVQRIKDYDITNNMISIDINKWLDSYEIEYLVQPFKDHRNAYSDDLENVYYELKFPGTWESYIEKYDYFTIESIFQNYSFIFLSLEAHSYDPVRIIYVGESYEQALTRLLMETDIEESINKKITESLICNGVKFQFKARTGYGDGYVKLITSYRELLQIATLIGIKASIEKKYPIKYINDVMTSFWGL